MKIQFNHHEPIEVRDGSTILDAAKMVGIKIPTLCHLDLYGVDGFSPIGACRVCLVEVEGRPDPMPACCTPATEGMKILTNSKMARESRRTVVELLLSEHNGDCTVCNRSEDCELHRLAREMGIKEPRYQGERRLQDIDDSTPALHRDAGKCINCRRCVEICSHVQGVGALQPQYRGFATYIGPSFGFDLDTVKCVQCGQCAAVCPVGAITEKDEVDQVWSLLNDKEKFVVVQTAPAIRAALGECFGNRPGTPVTGQMVTALRQLGFDAVFDTNFAADLTIIEEGTELLTRLKKAIVDKDTNVALPMYTSCSPGWILYAENYWPHILPNLSSCKSPQQMFGAVAKTFYAKKIGKRPEDIAVVSVMPCTAKKYESQRPEMNSSGVRDVDVVLTTRELGRMIHQAGIDFNTLPDGEMDAPLGLSSGAADIFGNTGGVMEAAIRTVYEIVTGRELPFANLHIMPIEGLQGVKEATLKIEGTVPEWSFLEGVEVKVAVAHGLSNAKKVIERVKNGEAVYHFVEVMTCPGGCIGGGGQPRFTSDEMRLERIHALYHEDEGKQLRKSHENPAIKQIYDEFLKEPLGEKSHHLLHTEYFNRNVAKSSEQTTTIKKVLLVDDDPDMVEIYSMMLIKGGFQPHFAHNIRDGLKLAKELKPDVIVLDVMMETTTDGFQLAQSIRHENELKYTPIMMLTSVGTMFDLRKDIGEHGEFLPVDGFVEKPSNFQTFVNMVRKLSSLPRDQVKITGTGKYA